MAQLMSSIAGTMIRANQDGLGISKHLLRQLVLTGVLPSVKVGKATHLINYNTLLRFLNTGSPIEIETPENNMIRRIEVR